MNRISRIAVVSTVAAVIAAVGTGAIAKDSDPPSAADTGIGILQAISTAERHASGKAVRADLEKNKGGQWIYEIEVISGAKAFDVKIDAAKGTVISSTEDKPDRDDD
jgi:uncharacterized membrane protein YkoI